MSNYKVIFNDSLQHHGIKGQKWGDRNGPPYPLDKSDYSEKEKKAMSSESSGKKGLTDSQKKAIKIGAVATRVALTDVGGYTLYKTDALNGLVSIGKKSLPGNLGGVANPLNLHDNCKDVAEAQIKRWLGVDASAVAGKNTVDGDLHKLVEVRKYNPDGIKWIGGDTGVAASPSGDSLGRVTKAILKGAKEGDCGIIGIGWDTSKVPISGDVKGHAFNWYVSNGKVLFSDDQPDVHVSDASKYLKLVDPEKQIEILKMTKEAFN